MTNSMFRKGLILGIIVLFILAGVIPSTVGIKKEKTTIIFLKSGDYIQDLIDNASIGDTIYIPNGTYYENIIINKSISLLGENKDTTIIDGNGNGTVVDIFADEVTISGFTIRNGATGIYLRFSMCIITGNKITSNKVDGICLLGSYTTIKKNDISSNGDFGIIIQDSVGFGGYISYSSGNIIFKNNFRNNSQDAGFEYIFGHFRTKLNIWMLNYWNEPHLLPKLILGKMKYIISGTWGFHIPWISIDWRPALKPNDI